MRTSSADPAAIAARGGMRGQAPAAGARALAARPLFEPLADLLARCAEDRLPSCEALDRWMAEARGLRPAAACASARFVVPDGLDLAYERRVYERAEIVTRPGNWHDFFNALVWIRFPRTKAALNAAHLRHMRAGAGCEGRGPVRDAVTQFDESGIAVAAADASLIDLLVERRWKELFWTRRADVATSMRFLVFGHGLYDALRAPFYRMCGRAAAIVVDRAKIERSVTDLCVEVDSILAARFAADFYPRPRALLALPLLGIPGVTPENASPGYYDDCEQFRPPPAWMQSAAAPDPAT